MVNEMGVTSILINTSAYNMLGRNDLRASESGKDGVISSIELDEP